MDELGAVLLSGVFSMLAVLRPQGQGFFDAIGVSGHTLKHLAAGAGGLWILRMLQKRKPIEDH